MKSVKIRSKKGMFLLVILCLSFIIPLTATFVSYQIARDEVVDKNEQEFDSLADAQEKAIQQRINSYIRVLRGVSGLFLASDKVTADEFRSYSDAVDPKESIPGALGIGYIADVPVDEINQYVRDQQESGNDGFAVKPDLNADNGYFIITFIEPHEVNDPAIGLNVAFEKNRREAAIESRRTGEPRITESIELVQDSTNTAGFLIFSPLYKSSAELDSDEKRIAAFEGWVYTPMIAKDFFEELTNKEEFSSIDVAVKEINSEDSSVNIYSDFSSPISDSKFISTREIGFLGQNWEVTFGSNQQFESGFDYGKSNSILYGGLILSLVSVILGIVIFRRSAYVEREVQVKTKELANSEDRFSRIVEGSNTGIWDWKDLSQDYIYWSPKFYELLGYENNEVKSSAKFFAEELLHPDDAEQSNKAFEDALKSNGKYKTEYRLKTKSGEYRWFDVLGVISLDENENVQRISGSISDITELRTAREKLKTSQERLSLAVDGSKIGLFDLFDVDNDEGYLSEQTFKMLGYEPGELESRASTLISRVHPDEQKYSVSNVMEAVKKLSDFDFECRLKKKDGSYIWVEAKGAVTINPDTGKKRITGSFDDISERKEVEKLKNEFVSTVSHELRTPLTSIRGSLGLLSGTMLDEMPEEAKKLVEIANRNSERLGVLINDILDMEKLTSGKLEFFIDAIEVGDLVNLCVSSIESFAKIHNVQIRTQPIAEGLKINVDPDRLSQVLYNLLSNAIKFSSEDSLVEVYVRKSEDKLRICVEDNGFGVPEEFRSKIFSQFSQSDSSSTRSQGGSGLGLYISQKFVERMNGAIGFDPKETGGTIFWIEFDISNGIQHKRIRAEAEKSETTI